MDYKKEVKDLKDTTKQKQEKTWQCWTTAISLSSCPAAYSRKDCSVHTHKYAHTPDILPMADTDTAMQRDEGKEPASKRVGGRKNEEKRGSYCDWEEGGGETE